MCVPVARGPRPARRFSNLRVEGGATNHWLVLPNDLVGFCRDDVVLLDTDADALRWHHTCQSLFDTPADDLGVFGGLSRRRNLTCLIHANSPLAGSEASGARPVLPSAMPFLQLRHLVSALCADDASFFLDYQTRADGPKPRRFERRRGRLLPGSDPRLASPPHWILRKLAYFRATPPDDRQVCAL